MEFEWDRNKEIKNIQKHGVTFTEAKSVFYDEDAILIYDHKHSEIEERFLLIGLSETIKTLVVSHCERIDNDGFEIIRIISSRHATTSEKRQYWQRKQNEKGI